MSTPTIAASLTTVESVGLVAQSVIRVRAGIGTDLTLTPWASPTGVGAASGMRRRNPVALVVDPVSQPETSGGDLLIVRLEGNGHRVLLEDRSAGPAHRDAVTTEEGRRPAFLARTLAMPLLPHDARDVLSALPTRLDPRVALALVRGFIEGIQPVSTPDLASWAQVPEDFLPQALSRARLRQPDECLALLRLTRGFLALFREDARFEEVVTWSGFKVEGLPEVEAVCCELLGQPLGSLPAPSRRETVLGRLSGWLRPGGPWDAPVAKLVKMQERGPGTNGAKRNREGRAKLSPDAWARLAEWKEVYWGHVRSGALRVEGIAEEDADDIAEAVFDRLSRTLERDEAELARSRGSSYFRKAGYREALELLKHKKIREKHAPAIAWDLRNLRRRSLTSAETFEDTLQPGSCT